MLNKLDYNKNKYKAIMYNFFKNMFKLLFILLPIVYLFGFIMFIKNLPKQEINSSFENQNIDAIVVLTGGQLRISKGLDMLKSGKAKLLFISGLFTESSLKNYKNILSHLKKIKYNNIYYDTVAKTTIENAQQVKIWASSNNIKSIYLVTSYYHIPRANYLIGKYIPDLKIINNPVFPINFNKNIYGIRMFSLIFFEYNKYILSTVFFSCMNFIIG